MIKQQRLSCPHKTALYARTYQLRTRGLASDLNLEPPLEERNVKPAPGSPKCSCHDHGQYTQPEGIATKREPRSELRTPGRPPMLESRQRTGVLHLLTATASHSQRRTHLFHSHGTFQLPLVMAISPHCGNLPSFFPFSR